MAFVIVSGLQRTALFFISLFGVGEGGGAEPYRGRETRFTLTPAGTRGSPGLHREPRKQRTVCV